MLRILSPIIAGLVTGLLICAALLTLLGWALGSAMAARRHPVCIAVDVEGIPARICARPRWR